jgi:hypothetical protein
MTISRRFTERLVLRMKRHTDLLPTTLDEGKLVLIDLRRNSHNSIVFVSLTVVRDVWWLCTSYWACWVAFSPYYLFIQPIVKDLSRICKFAGQMENQAFRILWRSELHKLPFR